MNGLTQNCLEAGKLTFKITVNVKNWFLYIILIPFLYPRGFDEYIPAYKNFFTLWLLVAIICIFILFLFELSKGIISEKPYFYWCMLYFFVMFIITFTIKQSFTGGLKKVFAIPSLCILCVIYFKKNPKMLIKSINNLLILIFLLNTTIFNPLLWKEYFEPITNHMTFLGHVQVGAQIGLIGILFAYLEYYFYPGNKKRIFLQVMLSAISMAISFTSAAYIALIILLVFYFLRKSKFQRIFMFKGQVYALVYFFINILLFIFIFNYGTSLTLLGFSLNGRGFIWREALNSFSNSPVYGYGVNGILIKVFWSYWTGDGQGMNYMHNQILQVLNDGGIILFIFFTLMIFSGLKNFNKLQISGLKFWSVVCMVIMLFIMTFESTMEYSYVFFMFAAFAYLPDIAKYGKPENKQVN